LLRKSRRQDKKSRNQPGCVWAQGGGKQAKTMHGTAVVRNAARRRCREKWVKTSKDDCRPARKKIKEKSGRGRLLVKMEICRPWGG
jgi:RNase P protein component